MNQEEPLRRRCVLHLNHIEPFAKFCASRGWIRVEPKGEWEILRMTHRGESSMLIVHVKARAKEHATTQGKSQELAEEFYKQPKSIRRGPR